MAFPVDRNEVSKSIQHCKQMFVCLSFQDLVVLMNQIPMLSASTPTDCIRQLGNSALSRERDDLSGRDFGASPR